VKPLAFGIGLQATSKQPNNKQSAVLETFFSRLYYQGGYETAEILASLTGYKSGNKTVQFKPDAIKEYLKQDPSTEISHLKNTWQPVVVTFIEENLPPTEINDVYLRLSLLSHRLVKPHEIDLTGIFGILPTVAWTNQGPIDPAEVNARLIDSRETGVHLEVYSVDKFPKMLNHVVPQEIRIGDGARVRLGAYLGAGTTVMHEGFVNFNAGTEGPNMIEGRVSAGVFVQQGSDLGGSASVMGTLSGGNETVISVGRDCLIGANAGTGIPLGDHCVIEAGLYLTAGAKVELLDESGAVLEVARARDLSFRPNLLFRRNSLSGAIQALPNKNKVSLNEELHAEN